MLKRITAVFAAAALGLGLSLVSVATAQAVTPASACVVSGSFSSDEGDTAPNSTPAGLTFTSPGPVDTYQRVSAGTLQGLTKLSYTLAPGTVGEAAQLVIEVNAPYFTGLNPLNKTGYATLTTNVPAATTGVIDAFNLTGLSAWSSSKITSGPGSLSSPESFSDLVTQIGNNTLLSAPSLHLLSGGAAGANSSTVSSISSDCGTTQFVPAVACVVSGGFTPDEGDTGPTATPAGLKFTSPGPVDTYQRVTAGTLQGLTKLSYVVAPGTVGEPAQLVIEVHAPYFTSLNASNTTGYATLTTNLPAGTSGVINAFALTGLSSWSSSKITSGPGSLSSPEPFSALVAQVGGNTLLSAPSLHLLSGGATGANVSTVSSVSSDCGTTQFVPVKACAVSGGFSSDEGDAAPLLTTAGLKFTSPGPVDTYQRVSAGTLQGLTHLSYTLAPGTVGEATQLVIEVHAPYFTSLNPANTSGYATLTTNLAAGVSGTVDAYALTGLSSWSSSKITSGPGSLSSPEPFSALVAQIGANTLQSAPSLHLLSGGAAGANVSAVAMVSSDCGTSVFSSPAAVRSSDESFVRSAYSDVLGRIPAASEVAYWTGQLAGGAPRTAVASGFNNSDEYRLTRINAAYTSVLGRAADAGGLSYWLGQMQVGALQPDDVHRIFLSTDEFHQNQGGGTDAGWIRALYTDILHRTADDAGVNYWLSQLGGHGRASVVNSIWFADETIDKQAAALFTTFLGRTGAPADVNYWAGLVRSNGLTGARNLIMATGEYGARAVSRFP